MFDYSNFWENCMDFFDDLPREIKMVVFCYKLVDACFAYFGIKQEIANIGRPPFDLVQMVKLCVYGSLNGISSSITLKENAKYHDLYKLVSDYLMPSDRTIRDYRSKYKDVFRKITSFTLILAYLLELTDFRHIALDGTIQKAFNSPFYVLKKKHIDLLLNHFLNEELSKEEIKELPRPVKKFLKNKKFDDVEKIRILQMLDTILDKSGQSSIALNDWTARWMHNKQHRSQLSYNIQVGVDTKTKLICGVNVSQSPTDHYEIPELMDIIIENLEGHQPETISADTIYRTIPNLTYLAEKDICFLIPTRKQGKSQINKLSKNKYSSDHFIFDHEKRVMICPNKKELKEYGPYECKPDKFGYQRQQFAYANSSACKNCPNKSECCPKSHHRTITRYGHELLDIAEQLMELEENKEEYKLRSCTVEAPNGTFKIYYHINELPIVGIKKVQGIFDMITASYNTKRLFNIFEKNDIDFKEIFEFMNALALYKGLNLPEVNLEQYYENQNEQCSV